MDTSDNSNSPTQRAQGKIPIKLVGAIVVIVLIVGALFVLTGMGQKSSSTQLTQNTTIATSTINSAKPNTTTITTNKTSTNVSAAPSSNSNKFSNASIISTTQFDSILGSKWAYFNTTNGSFGSSNSNLIYYAHHFKYNKTATGATGVYLSQNATTLLSYYRAISGFVFVNKSYTPINGTLSGANYTYGNEYRISYGSGGKITSLGKIGTAIIAIKGHYIVAAIIYNYTFNLTDAKALLQYQLNDLNTSG
jgi:hypothetical protein